MSEERDDRLIEAALNEAPRGGLTPEERREVERLERAFLSLSADAAPVPPPPAAKERLMARVRADARRRARSGRLALAASILLLAGAASFYFKSAPSARVADLSGDAFLNGKRLAVGDAVPAGSAVETAPGAWVNIHLGRRATVRLKDGAQVFFPRLRGAVELRLERGALFSHVRPGAKFSVRTPMAVAAVRGTTFFVQVDSPDRTYVCLCQGKLTLTGPGGARDLATDHHTALRSGPAGFEDAPMEGHTDDEAGALALLP